MQTIVFIFARGGSKGLPGKNILPLAGKPMIAWTIDLARSIERIDRVIVSTDSPEIADVARKFGADVPFMRPAELASDTSPEWLSWRHALSYLKENENVQPDIFLSLPATAPLRAAIDVENCLDEFEKNDCDVVITITEAHRNPYFNMVSLDAAGCAKLVIPPETSVYRRQDCPEVFDITTVAYALKPEFVLNNESLFSGKVAAVTVPVGRSIDIDNETDFQVAEFLMNQRLKADAYPE
jgi:CMP-N-acetylneuraminic acid synthetase